MQRLVVRVIEVEKRTKRTREDVALLKHACEDGVCLVLLAAGVTRCALGGSLLAQPHRARQGCARGGSSSGQAEEQRELVWIDPVGRSAASEEAVRSDQVDR